MNTITPNKTEIANQIYQIINSNPGITNSKLENSFTEISHQLYWQAIFSLIMDELIEAGDCTQGLDWITPPRN